MTGNNEIMVTYEVDGDKLTLTGDRIRRALNVPNATDNEVELFIELCRSQKLNPFINEAHLIKYGDGPASIVVGKDVFTKRAQRNERFKGFQAGITFVNQAGALQRREGSMLLDGERLVGGWCKVYVDGYENPMKEEVSFKEYAGRRKNGSLNQQWSAKPETMIRKVAIVHALREAFPDDLAGLYDEAEMGNIEPPKAKEDRAVVEAVAEPPEWVPEEVYAGGAECQPSPSWDELMGYGDKPKTAQEPVYEVEDF